MKSRFLYIIVTFFILSSNTSAQERLALVIGNGDYYSVPSLANPVHDAKYMAIVLKNLGFKVILKLNANKKAMKKAVREFGQGLHRNDVALFYYSGYGLQFNNQNYLVPVKANIKTYNNIKFEGFDVKNVLHKMQKANSDGVNIVILDASRDNMFQSYLKTKKGLAEMKAPLGFLLAYASAPNTPSYGNNKQRNSIYTAYLLNALSNNQQVSLSIFDMLRKVKTQVVAKTNRKQVPWKSDSLREQFCFGNCGASCPECSKLLNVCEKHLQANRLTSGKGGTALPCYQEVLKKDPKNKKALAGLDKIEARYVKWTEGALNNGRVNKAKQYIESLRQVKPESHKLAKLERRVYTPEEIERIKSVSTSANNRWSFFEKVLDISSSFMKSILKVWPFLLIVVIVIPFIWFGLLRKQKQVQRFAALNPFDYFRLLWWMLVIPQHLINYREKFGEADEMRLSKWLASSLIWLPLLIPNLALGLELFSHANNALLPNTFLSISAGLLGCWLLVGWLGDLDKDFAFLVVLLVTFGMGFGVAGIVAGGLEVIVAVIVAVLVAFIVAFVRNIGFAFFVAFIVAAGMAANLEAGLEAGLEACVAGIVMVGIAFFVAVHVKASLTNGKASWLARFAFLLLISAHLFLIYYCFLGGLGLF